MWLTHVKLCCKPTSQQTKTGITWNRLWNNEVLAGCEKDGCNGMMFYWPSVSFEIQLHVIKNHLRFDYRINISLPSFFAQLFFINAKYGNPLETKRIICEKATKKELFKVWIVSFASVILLCVHRPDSVIDVLKTRASAKKDRKRNLRFSGVP